MAEVVQESGQGCHGAHTESDDQYLKRITLGQSFQIHKFSNTKSPHIVSYLLKHRDNLGQALKETTASL